MTTIKPFIDPASPATLDGEEVMACDLALQAIGTFDNAGAGWAAYREETTRLFDFIKKHDSNDICTTYLARIIEDERMRWLLKVSITIGVFLRATGFRPAPTVTV